MAIIVVAGDEQREELEAGRPFREDVLWMNNLPEASTIAGVSACIDLLFDNSAARINRLKQMQLPLTVINSVEEPLKEETADFIRINGWRGFLRAELIEAAGPVRLREEGEKLFEVFNKKLEWVDDRPGFITARVIACIINEAYLALEENVSTREEIDIAMKLGTNYPFGPFEWSKRIGINNIAGLLKKLAEKQDRYRPSDLLIKEASS